MKVLMINGSPHPDGNTALALKEMAKVFASAGVETEILTVGMKDIRGCIGCRQCLQKGKCVFDDLVNETAEKLAACDGLVIGSPVYYGSANGTLISFLDRLFYSTNKVDKTMKVGACIVAARRSGTTFTYDELNKYFGISGMPIASGRYWNNIYGQLPGEAKGDLEGLQNARILARNMLFLMKSIQLGKEAFGLPEKEPVVHTNFIRQED